MKKLTYSDIDSSSSSNLKHGTIYLNDDQASLRVRVVNEVFNNSYNNYIEFLPSVLDSTILDSDNDDFTIRLGDRRLRFAELEGDDDILLLSGNSEDKIVAHTSIKFDSPNDGIKFANGDFVAKNPVLWTFVGLSDPALQSVMLSTNVADFINSYVELMIVVRVGTEHISSLIPTQSILTYPASFPIYKNGTEVASVMLNDPTDLLFTTTFGSADNLSVYAR